MSKKFSYYRFVFYLPRSCCPYEEHFVSVFAETLSSALFEFNRDYPNSSLLSVSVCHYSDGCFIDGESEDLL